MGHAIESWSFDINKSKREIVSEINEYVEDNSDTRNGLYRGIRWLDSTIYRSYDEAAEAISRLDKGDYDQLAVLYKEGREKDIQGTRQYILLKDRVIKLKKELDAMIKASTDKVLERDFLVCKNCRSRIAAAFWKRSTCPVCGHDFRAPTTLSYIKAKQDSVTKAENALKEYIAEYGSKNGKTMWLVKFEYHV